MIRRRLRPLALAALLGAALLPHPAAAEFLHELYLARVESGPEAGADDADRLAAELDVQLQQRRRLPKLELKANELWINQSIRQSGNVAFPRGREEYRGRRLGVELDQPLYDPTIGPQIAAARARQRQVASLGEIGAAGQTRALVEGFVTASRHHQLSRATASLITRLETELSGVTRSQEARVATVADVQNIRLALSATRLERNKHEQGFIRAVGAIGAEAVATRGWASLRPEADPLELVEAATGRSVPSPEVELLYARAEEERHKAAATRRRTLPTFSLVGYYGMDDAEASLFGGPRDYRFFEGGIAMRWAIFDRGMNYSEARQSAQRQRAAEAAARARSGALQRDRGQARRLLDEAAAAVRELGEIVAQHEVLMTSASRAYAAGQESYMNMVRAYLAYESSSRDLVNARHDLLEDAIAHLGEAVGWSEELVKQVDACFARAPATE
jgi:outer membrane protein TolC